MRLSAPIYRLKRDAKRLSRRQDLPLNAALNRIAQQEGFASWSLLAARFAGQSPAGRVLSALVPGDLVLLAARPGHGKTIMGLEMVARTVAGGQPAAFFTLEYTREEASERLTALDPEMGGRGSLLTLDTSDGICAGHIAARMAEAERGTVVVVDYLQLLDQDRRKPPLVEQVAALKAWADAAGVIVVLISQVDRAYDPVAKELPDLADIRLPNPVDLCLFSKAVFLNDGEVRLAKVA